MAKFDIGKYQTKIKKELEKEGKSLVKSLSDREKKTIGDDVILVMKQLISKGISPISNWGRFPAYKWAAVVNSLTGRSTKSSKSKGNSVSGIKSSKYPYNQRDKYPDKAVRPVNLYLSGEFLNSLESRATAKGVVIGFDNKLSELKESGHRDGVNTQPKRPIIPNSNEEFTPQIYQRLIKTIQLIFNKKIK